MACAPDGGIVGPVTSRTMRRVTGAFLLQAVGRRERRAAGRTLDGRTWDQYPRLDHTRRSEGTRIVADCFFEVERELHWPSDDGHAVQCVGAWAKEGEARLSSSVHRRDSREVRRKYVEPPAPGGAAFIDLFAGPGRVRIRETGEILSTAARCSPCQHPEAPFTRTILCDVDSEKRDVALRASRAVWRPLGHCRRRLQQED